MRVLSNQMSGLKAVHFVAIVPIVLGLWYMLLHEDLSSAAVILIACLAFTTVMMFIVFKIQEVRLKEESPRVNDGIDRSMFKVCKSQTTPAVFKMLQECTASNTPKAGVLSILQYLRETVRTDALVAVELAELSAVKHVIKTLGFKTLDPKSAVASLELVNEVLSSRPAKLKLITNVEELQATVDAAYLWLIAVLYSLVSELQLPPSTVQLSNSAITAISGMGVNLFELTAGPTLQFPAGLSGAVRIEHLVSICSKTLVTVGLLCSDECPDAQTRFTDRGGVQVLLSAVNTALLMCSTASVSNGIGAESSSGGAVNNATQVNDRVQRLKQSALLCKWDSWCLFNLTLEHPPSKAELFHSGGIRVLLDALKLHTVRNSATGNTAGSTSQASPGYINCVHVHRQGLALLLNLIAPSPQYAQYAYSQAQARQMMMANSIVEVLESAKVNFKKEKDILTTCRAIANIIMVDYS